MEKKEFTKVITHNYTTEKQRSKPPYTIKIKSIMHSHTNLAQIHLDFQKSKGFKVIGNLAYCTEDGIEYFIGLKDNQALVTVFSDDDRDTMEGISKEAVKEMILTAKTYGINTVIIDTNFGVNIHSKDLKTVSAYKGLHIVKTSLQITN